MALFGERTSVSPRLPSPWQAALAQPSPAISVIARSDVLRTPSQLSLSTTGSAQEDPSGEDEATRLAASVMTTSSLASSSAFQRLRSSGISEDLILSPTPGYTSSTSVSLSTSTSASAILNIGAVRQGVSGGLAGQGYEGVKLVAERDKVGHIEYKLRLLPPNAERFERLTTQLKWRLQEGGGQAVYEIGVLDDGTLIGITDADMDRSLQTLELMAAELGATVMVLRTITLASPPPFPRALCGYQAGSEGNEQDWEAQVDPFGGDAVEHNFFRPMKKKKKKSPKPPKPKQKPSVFGVIAADKDAWHDAVSASAGNRAALRVQQRDTARDLDYQQRARQKSQAKMARRRLSAGFPAEGLSAKQRKAWGMGRKGKSIWDDYDSDAFVEHADGLTLPSTDSARIETHVTSAIACSEPPATAPDGDEDAPVAESWRARNMERASQQDPDRWRYKSAMTVAERDQVTQSRRARQRSQRQSGDQGGFTGFFGSDESGEEHLETSEHSSECTDAVADRRASWRTDSDHDDGEEMFLFENLSSSEIAPPELTHAAVAALNTAASDQPLDSFRSPKEGFYPEGSRPEHPLGTRSNTREPTIKQAKKRRVRVQRAEQRRLDLLRGDGITADGIPLALDPDNQIGATSVMEAELNESLFGNGETEPDVLQIVRKMVGEDSHDIDDIPKGETAGMAALLSTSPSYTIKPSSPSAHRMFSLPSSLPRTSQALSAEQNDDEFDPAPPSPSDTITMPLDNLSLSFSQAEVYTAVSPFESPGGDSYKHSKSTVKHDDTLSTDDGISSGNAEKVAHSSREAMNLNLVGARVCVEALIVKKMDMDDHYLDFSGFIL